MPTCVLVVLFSPLPYVLVPGSPQTLGRDRCIAVRVDQVLRSSYSSTYEVRGLFSSRILLKTRRLPLFSLRWLPTHARSRVFLRLFLIENLTPTPLSLPTLIPRPEFQAGLVHSSLKCRYATVTMRDPTMSGLLPQEGNSFSLRVAEIYVLGAFRAATRHSRRKANLQLSNCSFDTCHWSFSKKFLLRRMKPRTCPCSRPTLSAVYDSGGVDLHPLF
jgi:hypothetical protein